MRREAKANVPGIRQETQYTCMATSLTACLQAHGKQVSEADVNKVLGAGPFRGASWEELLAAAQYFGMRGTLVVPATLEMLRSWTGKNIPVIIAWNPEGRPWSHASVVLDVTEDDQIVVMDPNMPDPNETFRNVPKEEFYRKWGEPIGDTMIVRRPAMAVEREVTPEGRQMVASKMGKSAGVYAPRWRRQEYGDGSRNPGNPNRVLAPRPTIFGREKDERIKKAWGLVLALLHEGRAESSDWDFALKWTWEDAQMTPAQQELFDSLLDRYRSFTQRIPDAVLGDRMLNYVKGMAGERPHILFNPRVKNWMEEHFDVQPHPRSNTVLLALSPKTASARVATRYLKQLEGF